jgi:hypothetical protein
MSNAAKKVYAPGELDAAEVAHACSQDPSRPHLHTPFGCLLGGHGFICATDGHRVAAVRSDDWRAYQRSDAPRLEAVLARNFVEIGEIGNGSEQGSGFPASWSAVVTLHPSGVATLDAYFERGPKKNRRRISVLKEARVEWLAHHLRLGETAIGLDLGYLVDAMAHVGTPTLYMHAEPGRKGVDPLSPVVLTSTSKPPFECHRFAVVMPVRL